MNDFSFGNYLTSLRMRRGYSQYQLGHLVGVTDKAVSKWENGSAKPRIATCIKLAELLGVDVNDLLNAGSVEETQPSGIAARNRSAWALAEKMFYVQYGEHPPLAFRDRWEAEKASMAQSDIAVHLDALGMLAEQADREGCTLIVRDQPGTTLLAWLLGATCVNPLPPHAICPECHRVVLHPEVRDGWDLREEKCSCGATMHRNGHGLPFEGFAHSLQSGGFKFTVNVPASYQSRAEELLRSFYQNDFTVQSCRWEYFGHQSCRALLLLPGQQAHTDEVEILTVADYAKYRDDTAIMLIPSDTLEKLHDHRLRCGRAVPERLALSEPALRRLYAKHGDALTEEIMPYMVSEEEQLWGNYSSYLFADNYDIVKGARGVPCCFSLMVQIDALAHGNGAWDGNGQWLIDRKESTWSVLAGEPFPSELLSEQTVTFMDLAATREDVWHIILAHSTALGCNGTGLALHIMEEVWHGHCSVYAPGNTDILNLLRELNLPQWYIEHLKRIISQPSKAECIQRQRAELMLCWYEYFEKLNETNEREEHGT